MNEDIKAGDIIYCCSIQSIQRLIVTKTTPTIIEVEGVQLNRNPTRRGDKSRWTTWTWTYHRATPELDEQYEKQELLSQLGRKLMRLLTLDQLRRIVAIAEEETPPNAN